MQFKIDKEINLFDNKRLQNCFYILEKNNKYLLCYYESFSPLKISVKYGPKESIHEILDNDLDLSRGKFIKDTIFI